jgi:hypothetical protein
MLATLVMLMLAFAGLTVIELRTRRQPYASKFAHVQGSAASRAPNPQAGCDRIGWDQIVSAFEPQTVRSAGIEWTGSDPLRSARVNEWQMAVASLYADLRAWIHAANPNAIIETKSGSSSAGYPIQRLVVTTPGHQVVLAPLEFGGFWSGTIAVDGVGEDIRLVRDVAGNWFLAGDPLDPSPLQRQDFLALLRPTTGWDH